jgi:hypothetical protein
MELANLGIKQVPESEAIKPIETVQYPTVEKMTFTAVITSEAEGMALLRAVQLIVNTFGAQTCISAVTKLEKNPKLVDKVKSNLPC